MSFNIFQQTLCSGDNIPLKLTFTDKVTGNPYSLVGMTVGITVKPMPDNTPDTGAPFMQSVVGDSTGVINFVIPPLAAGDYWTDVKIWQTSGGSQIRTTALPAMQMHLIQSVTARTTP